MKKISKALLSLVLVLSVLFSVLSVNTLAAGTYISFSKSSVTVGSSLTVTVTVDAGEPIYAVSCVVNYNSSVLEYKSGSGTGGAGTLKIIESPSGETKVSYSLTFNAIAAGSCVVSLADCVYSTQGENGAEDKGVAGSSATVTVNDVTLSSNANLKALSVSKGKLSPSFSASRTSYTVSVDNSVTECAVYATPSDSGAKVSVSGSSTLKIGDNVRTVTVTAPNGSQKTYTVTIKRSATVEPEEPTTPEEETPDPLQTSIDGVEYTVSADISDVTLFKGFTATEIDYNGTKVSVAKDTYGNFTLYYLKSTDSETKVPYTYNDTDKVFTKLKYCTQGENNYIFAEIPAEKTVPTDFYATNVEISGMNVNSFASNKSGMSDFYYIYCFADGSFGFYRYDSKENSLQRYPELSLVDANAVQPDDTENNAGGFLGRFNTLSGNAKIIVIGLILVVIGAIALIVLLVLKLIQRRKFAQFEDGFIDEDDFDDITLENFALLTDDVPEEQIQENVDDQSELENEETEQTEGIEETE